MLITLWEIFDIIIMTLAIGFIFSDFIRQAAYSAGIHFKKYMNIISFSILVAAPGIVLHEMGHKFISLILGIPAVFHAAYVWLGIGVLLKLFGSPFVFFVPGYVSHPIVSPQTGALIAFFGPLMNLLLWLIAYLLLKYDSFKKSRKWRLALEFTKKINMFLFIFNMIPIPPFDGYHVFYGLFKIIF